MAWVRRRLNRVELRLDRREREILLRIVDELRAGLGDDPRTRPRAYDDPGLDAEYQRYSRPEVEHVRAADIDTVRTALSSSDDRFRLSEEEALTWVRALNHLRLVAGARLGIDDDGWEERSDATMLEREEYAMLVTLGWVQENVVAALGG
ncbi:MAG TPA: DUF2017 family protein [Candidatus Dormibacteraeota bacterium]